MDIKKSITDKELNLLYNVADDFQTKGYTNQKCPRCGGELKFVGNKSAYRITCVKNCGINLAVRGI
jgi:tRNA(Ile2) C34 agmatinyltransferase TiaS